MKTLINKAKQTTIKLTNILMVATLLLGISLIGFSGSVSAAQITTRKITLSDPGGAATGVTYTFTSAAVPTTGTAIKSVGIQFCTTASGACSTPSGFSVASSTLSSQPTGLGSGTGWTVSTATAGSLRVVNAANATTPSGAVTIVWGGVVNPTANNNTFYGRVTTYSDSTWTTAVDTGTVALATSQQITVTASVDETLSFCTGTSITGTNCGTVAGSSVALGTLSSSAASTGTSVMAASTNAGSGYAVTVNGATLTSGSNTIAAATTAGGATSTPGSEQFGLNVRSNSSPSVGADPSGASGYTYGTGYGTANQFKFVTGGTVVSTAAATNGTTYTVSYLANIAGTTPPGTYTSNLTYIATATF